MLCCPSFLGTKTRRLSTPQRLQAYEQKRSRSRVVLSITRCHNYVDQLIPDILRHEDLRSKTTPVNDATRYMSSTM